jgi:hypothetical protein
VRALLLLIVWSPLHRAKDGLGFPRALQVAAGKRVPMHIFFAFGLEIYGNAISASVSLPGASGVHFLIVSKLGESYQMRCKQRVHVAPDGD